MAHVDVLADTFQREVIDRSHEVPVVVDFWADWCGPCKALGPVLERLADDANGRWVLAKVDTDQAQDLAMQYQIRGIPAVKAFKNGKVIDEFVGALPQYEVESWLKGFVADEADDLVAAGDALLADGHEIEARAKFRAALEIRPRHEGALLSLAELSDPEEAKALLKELPSNLEAELASRRARIQFSFEAGDADAERLRGRIERDPKDLDARWLLAHRLAADGHWEAALEQLLEIVKTDRNYRDDGARKAMLLVFDAVGVRSEIADTWRDRLSQTLY